MQYGWPLPKRLELLSKLDPKQATLQYPLKFQNKSQQWPQHRVPVEIPKYRLVNGRTQAAQQEYLARHKELPRDLFSKDEESSRGCPEAR